MKKFDDIQDREEMFNNYPQESKELIAEFVKVLGITDQEAHDIIISNVSALMFLYFNSTITIKGMEESLKLLIKSTIFRQDDGMYEINDVEKKRVKKYYDIDIK